MDAMNLTFEVRSMRDTITALIDDMIYKASLHPEVAKEVDYAIKMVTYAAHDAQRAITSNAKKEAEVCS